MPAEEENCLPFGMPCSMTLGPRRDLTMGQWTVHHELSIIIFSESKIWVGTETSHCMKEMAC